MAKKIVILVLCIFIGSLAGCSSQTTENNTESVQQSASESDTESIQQSIINEDENVTEISDTQTTITQIQLETDTESEFETDTEPEINLSTLFADNVFPSACNEYEKVFGKGNYLAEFNGMSAAGGSQTISFEGFGFPLKMKVKFIGIPEYSFYAEEETCFVSIYFTETPDNPDEASAQTAPLDGEIHELVFTIDEAPDELIYFLLEFHTPARYMAVTCPTN